MARARFNASRASVTQKIELRIYRARLSSLLFSSLLLLPGYMLFFSPGLPLHSFSVSLSRFSFSATESRSHGILTFSSVSEAFVSVRGMRVIRSCCPSSFKGVQPPFPRATFRGESDHRDPTLSPSPLSRPLLSNSLFLFLSLLLRPSSTQPFQPPPPHLIWTP